MRLFFVDYYIRSQNIPACYRSNAWQRCKIQKNVNTIILQNFILHSFWKNYLVFLLITQSEPVRL